MARAAMIDFGLDPGKFVRSVATIGMSDILRMQYVTLDDYNLIKQILLDGCPAQLTFEEPSSNKLEFMLLSSY